MPEQLFASFFFPYIFFFIARLKLCKTFPPNMNIVFVINVLKLAKSPVWSFHVKTNLNAYVLHWIV